MNKNDVFYGLEAWERLESDPDDAVERVLEYACREVGEGFDAMAARVEWPIRILAYRRKVVPVERRAARIAARAIEDALEDLDADYSDPDGNETEPTEGMKAAALAFAKAVIAEYVPYTCEPTGEVIEYTREQVEKDQVTP